MTEKKLIAEVIFKASNKDNPLKFKDIKGIVQDEDYIISEWVEPHESENNSWEGHYHIELIRERLETDEELEKRLNVDKEQSKFLKDRRYQHYLKLKKEFEGE